MSRRSRKRKLVSDPAYSVSDVSISPDGKYIGYHGMSASRYERGNLEQNDYADLYLVEIASGKIERLTKNTDIAEGSVSFSPDSKMVAFSAPDDFKFMRLERIYIRPIANPAAPWKKLGGTFDYDVRIGRGGGDGVETKVLVGEGRHDLLQHRLPCHARSSSRSPWRTAT